MRIRPLGLVLTLSLTSAIVAAALPDRDGDGILDEHEAILGTDPASPEALRVVIDDGPEPEKTRKTPGYDATKDILRIEFGHVAGDRCLWRATFAAEPRLADTVFHLYVDADADAETGRKVKPPAPEGRDRAPHHGTDYMLSVVGGRGTSSRYNPDGTRTTGPVVTHVVHGKTLLVSADVDVTRDAKGIRCALYVLCHTTTQAGQQTRMSDSTGKHPIAGIPLTGRKKILRPADHMANFAVDATFGLDILRRILRAEDTVVVRHDQLALDGFEIDPFTSRRFPHLKLLRRDGRASATAPRAGRYHVGFMMYDDAGRTDRVCIHVDGRLRGIAVANQDNNRTWLYWLREPLDLRGGERIELRGVGGGGGAHGIINLLFLPRPPKIRAVPHEVEHMTAVSPADHPRRVVLSWTTSWPCATRLEYGTDRTYRTHRTYVDEDVRCHVHRAILDGLDPSIEHHARAIGTTRDGKPFHGPDFVFRARPPKPPATREGTHVVLLTVRNPHPFAVEDWPITTGIPFPRGELASLDHVRLLGEGGEEPAQVKLAARWPDGSAKWLLVTFFADAAANGTSAYRLEYGRGVRRAPVPGGVTVRSTARSGLDEPGTGVRTAGLDFFINPHGGIHFDRLRGRDLAGASEATGTTLWEPRSGSWSAGGGLLPQKPDVTVQEAGPLRATLRVVSHIDTDGLAKRARIEKRIEAYRGRPYLRIHLTFTVTGGDPLLELGSLVFGIPVLRGRVREVLCPMAKGGDLRLAGDDNRVLQRHDDEMVVFTSYGDRPGPSKGVAKKGRLVGAFLGERSGGVAVRDFWQNYPMSFTKTERGCTIGLCPTLDGKYYDRFPFEKEGHHLYYHLRNGVHRLKRGMSKTYEIFVCLEPRAKSRQLCALFQRPLLATAPAEWYCKSGAFYDVQPRDTERFPLYEQAIDRNIAGYIARRERQRDYGMLNFGDWYGERGSNWGNVEYDTQHAFFLEHIRSGNPDAFFLGCATELHNRDIDTVHWSPDGKNVGGVYVHQMCHVGDYYKKGVPGTLGFPRGGFTVSHAWVEGHFDHYFLTGDRRSCETGRAVADYFIRKQLGRPYDFLTTRTPGWHLIMLASAYAATHDPYYLNAMRVVVERVLETQDVEPRPLPAHQREGRKPYQVGGWSRMMVPGHCQCEPRHRGNAGFMVAVLLSGLKYYHDVTGDPRVKEAIIRGAHYLLDECYSDTVKGFRYTSCPKTGYRPGASPLMVEGIARAYLWTKDERFRRCLADSLPLGARGSSYGKGFSMYYRMAPRLLADLAKAGITLGKKE